MTDTDAPLAQRMRPKSLDEVKGQDKLLKKGSPLRRHIEKDTFGSLIFWGPPGSGKTTIARLIAQATSSEFIELSAVQASKKDVMEVIKNAQTNRRLGQKTILFIDEIHRFNKAQQDAFLPYVEDGTIRLIGATTENPSFEVITPLLSRSQVIILEPLSENALEAILSQALDKLGQPAKLNSGAISLIAKLAQHDARVALGYLEQLLKLFSRKKELTPEDVTAALQKQPAPYDKDGEQHYNIISAFIKSMRGSDPNATFYYLARMLRAGEDPKFIARRMVIFASEDVGIAASQALVIANATFQAVEKVGLPECQYNLFHCALALAKCPKSREATDGMHAALRLAEEHSSLPVPLGIRNAPTKLMKDLGYGKNYQWDANYKPDTGFLPDEIRDIDFFSTDT